MPPDISPCIESQFVGTLTNIQSECLTAIGVSLSRVLAEMPVVAVTSNGPQRHSPCSAFKTRLRSK
jgi:hypothetical protein